MPHCAVELLYNFPRAHLHLGQALMRLKRYPEAASALEVCITQASGYREAHAELATCYEAMGENAKALQQRLLA